MVRVVMGCTLGRLGRVFVFMLMGVGLAACANAPRPELRGQTNAGAAPQAVAFAPAQVDPRSLRQAAGAARQTPLTGRVLRVDTIDDIQLRPKEVILTFDDGPAGRNTQTILDALDAKGVKATFFMVGQMARARPAQARSVIARGHTVGSHTNRHPNLATMSHASAVAEIARGERALREAGIDDIAFFRFPYLVDTGALRRHLAGRGIVVVDVDIDSKDYFRTSPARVAQRTMDQLRRRGSGIILFHDLHARTAAMLPSFLNMLEREGYTVVALRPARGNPLQTVSLRR